MPVAWRIVEARHAATAFDGEGARRYGGRWNSQGRRLVYASATLSLAALEVLVHLPPLSASPTPLRHVAFPAAFDEGLVERFPRGDLPQGWNAEPPGVASMAIGDEWLREMRSAALAVPSAIVPEEFTLLLNPQHPGFARIAIGAGRPFVFDPRLLG